MRVVCVGGPRNRQAIDIGVGALTVEFPVMVPAKRMAILDGPNADRFWLDPFEWVDPDCRMTFTSDTYELQRDEHGFYLAHRAPTPSTDRNPQ